MRTAIETFGAYLLYSPPYSPDLNPLEQVFAKLKALLRKAAAPAFSTSWHAVGRLLQRLSPAECANYFKNAGYAQPNQNLL